MRSIVRLRRSRILCADRAIGQVPDWRHSHAIAPVAIDVDGGGMRDRPLGYVDAIHMAWLERRVPLVMQANLFEMGNVGEDRVTTRNGGRSVGGRFGGFVAETWRRARRLVGYGVHLIANGQCVDGICE